MKQESYELFKNASLETIVQTLAIELKTRNESPFWADKVVPFSSAILSIFDTAQRGKSTFTPEGYKAEELTPELFFMWNDFVSLKTLAFTIQKSNAAGELLRTKIEPALAKKYKTIDLSLLGAYLSRYTVNLENEDLDFPISNYNLHQGVSNVIKSLL